MKGERLTHRHARHPHTGVPDGFHGFPAGVCPWCSGDEGVDESRYIRHNRPCPVWRIELNEFGGIHRKTRIGPPFKRLSDL